MQLDLLTYPLSPGYLGKTIVSRSASKEAAQKVEQSAKAIREKVKAVLANHPEGLTAPEVADILGMYPRRLNSVRSRLTELTEKENETNPYAEIADKRRKVNKYSEIALSVYRVREVE